MTNYLGIHHVSLVVTDVEKAKHFYGDILGFQQSDRRPDFDFPGVWYDIGETQLHLIVHEPARSLRGTNEVDSRDGHFAIRVADVQAVLQRLRQHGIAYEDKPNSVTGWHQVFTTDPDGNVIEFNQ